MTARVLALHGVVADADRRQFAFRNLLPTHAFRRYLKSSGPFVALRDALSGQGTALTIDDATRAAADAALLARDQGHPVTLFINPGQIESGAPYHFLLLSALMDQLDGSPHEFAGQVFSTETLAHRQAVLRVIEDSLRAIPGEPQRLSFVIQLAKWWSVDDLKVPAHLETLTRTDLLELVRAGVDLQNHGWSHSHHAALSPLESAREVQHGRDWIWEKLGAYSRWFAVPFGDAMPHDSSVNCDTWLTSNGDWNEGWIARSVFNRRELLLPAPVHRSYARSASVLLKQWRGLLGA